MSLLMTDVEALLSVDAGRTPPGTLVFSIRDPEVGARRAKLVFALLAAGAGVACAISHAGLVPTTLLLVVAGIFGIQATPSIADDADERPCKKPIMVVTPNGIILRDDDGLHRWQFSELDAIEDWSAGQRALLALIAKDGKPHVIDYSVYRRGERLREELRRRLSGLVA